MGLELTIGRFGLEKSGCLTWSGLQSVLIELLIIGSGCVGNLFVFGAEVVRPRLVGCEAG